MVNIVVAKYNENIEWTKKINHKVTVYDKSEKPAPGSIKLKNVGREGETFLYHIVNNYNNLDEVTVFLQGNPFEHLQVLVGWRSQLTSEEIDIVINKMNTEINDSCDFTTFYQVLYNVPNFTNNVDTRNACIKYYNEEHSYFTVSPGAQYIVPKKQILSRPLEFWKKLHLAMYNNETLNGYCQEQLWYLAYNHKMNNNVGNHDQEKFRCINSPPSFNYTPYSYFSRPSDIYTNRDLKLHPYGVLRFKHYNMKILFIKSGIHPKNLNFILNCKKIEFTIVNHVNEIDKLNISDYDAVYSPCEPIDVSKYPNTKFIFGPHFSIFPHQPHMTMIRNNNNVVYIQPSDWVVNLWKNNQFCNNINIKSFAFGVETERFCEILPLNHRSMVFVYFKSRNHKELNAIVNFLQSKNIEFRLFHYTARYSEEEYITCLQNSKYGIWLGRHESQGFALEEALSCNVPLLVWNVTSMNQEEGTNYNDIPGTTIPYWDERCGEYFYNANELENTFNKFLSKIETYKPRDYVLENLSFGVCEEKLVNMIKNINIKQHNTNIMEKAVTLFITSCGRPELLKRTLESFVKYNTYPIKEAILCEDSGIPNIADFVKDILPYPITFCYNPVRIGQMKTIEKYTTLIKTPYVFHLEDDYEFFDYGFIELSFKIMETDPKISQVLLEDEQHTYSKIDIGNPLCYKVITYDFLNVAGVLTLFSWRPSLKKIEIQKLRMPYEDWDDEYTLQLQINKLGYYSVVTKNIKDGRPGFCTHIGRYSHVFNNTGIKIPVRTDFPDKINIGINDI